MGEWGCKMKRVVITGMGALSSVGNNPQEMWSSLINKQSGIDYITNFDASNLKVKLAGEVKNFHPEEFFNPNEIRKLDRSALLALVASKQAYLEANLPNGFDRDRFGVFIASGIGGIITLEEEAKKALTKGPDRVSPFFVPNSIINLIGGQVAIFFNAKGPNIPVVTACASSTNAIGEAFNYIRYGKIDLALCGGSEAPLSMLGVSGFSAMRALNTSSDKTSASIPFDKRRSGFVMAEGAGILMIEELNFALKRKAHILAEIVGYGTNCDAYHITSPDPEAEGISKCMKLALDDANINYQDINYINAHGTSTVYNDKLETLGIKKVFKDYAYSLPISSTKSATGHALAAAGGIEAVISIMALRNNLIPPTINYQEKDEDCDLDYTVNEARKKPLNYCMSNNFGFGGQNASLIFKKYLEG